MQRRWAAIYLAFFLVMAVSAYSVLAVAEEPGVTIDGETCSEGDTVEIDGVTYTFSEVADRDGSIESEGVSEQQTVFENGSSVEYRDGEYAVEIESGEEPDAFELIEQFDVESILENDDAVENETITREDGNEYVVYREDGSTQLLSEYLPEPDREQFSVGSSIEHDNATKTVESVTSDEVTLVWEAEDTQTIDINEGKIVELGGTEYVMTFVDDNTVMLSTDVDGYDAMTENRNYFEQRLSGLVYVIIFSLGAGFLVGALAFLPRRG